MSKLFGCVLAGIGGGILCTAVFGTNFLIIAGVLNAIFDWWPGIPRAILWIAAVVGPIAFAHIESGKKESARFAKNSATTNALIAGLLLGVVVLTGGLFVYFSDWFTAGGKAWFKLAAIEVGATVIGFFVLAIGSALITGGK